MSLPMPEFWFTDIGTSCLIQLERMFYYLGFFIPSWKEVVRQELFGFCFCFVYSFL